MYKIIQSAHSGWAYVVLLALVIAIINSLIGFNSKREFSANDKRMALFGLLATHIQFVIGLIVYFVSPLGSNAISQMGNSELRLTALEHPITNIIAIILITIGWSKHKKVLTGNAKFKTILIFYALGLLMLVSRIPWKNWM